MTTVDVLRSRVAAGAAWLDENEPGWRDRIDVDRLDLRDGVDCVLGQLLGEEAPERDGIVTAPFDAYLTDHGLDLGWARDHGFFLAFLTGDATPGTGRLPYRELNDLWVDELSGVPAGA